MNALYSNCFVCDSTSLNKTGVYKLYHLSDPSRIYIGSTFNKGGFYKRWRNHLYALSKSRHPNKRLQSVSDLGGVDKFRFEIMKLIEDRDKGFELEESLIQSFNTTNSNFGYNLTSFANPLHILKNLNK